MSHKAATRENLWTLAFHSLPPATKEDLEKYQNEKAIETLDATLRAVRDKQLVCLQKRWTVKTKAGKRLIVRDILDKVAFWINRFKEVGDIAVQYDPSHASLPWAGVRVLLQASINDLQTFTSVAEGLETLALITTRYSILENIYLPSTGQALSSAQSKLCDALVALYSESLKYLDDIGKYYERSTAKRIARSLVDSSHSVETILKSISTKEAEVEKIAQTVQTEILKEKSDQLGQSLIVYQNEGRSSVESLKNLFHSLEAPLIRLSDPLVQFQELLDLQERRRFLMWLSNESYKLQHETTYKEVVPGTAHWILSHKEYQSWQASSVCSTLWVHGIPGCGKTKLASVIIQQHLDSILQNSCNAPVAYIYCSNTKTSLSSLTCAAILRNVVKQLAVTQQGQKVRQGLWDEFKKRQKAADMDGLDPLPLTVDECVQMLLELTLDCPATIIIDGLDELVGNQLDILTSLQTLENESSSLIKIMISSREDTYIAQELHDAISLPVTICQNSEDIKTFVQHSVSSAITNRKLLGGSVSASLKNHLVESLYQGARGMFLWPAMQLEYLCDRRKFKLEEDIVEALKALPPSLVSTFDNLYARINLFEHHAKTMVMRIFAWLIAKERELSASELLMAISSNEKADDSSISIASGTIDPQLILDLCCNFVIFDDNMKRFSFIHSSVLEYLQALPEYSVSMTNFIAAKRCIDYFLLDSDASTDTSSTEDETDSFESHESFRNYAISYWAYHYLKVADIHPNADLDNSLKQLLSPEEPMNFHFWLDDVKDQVEAKRPNLTQLKELNAMLNDQYSPLFMACVYGLAFILEFIEAEALRAGKFIDFNMKNSHGASALYVSARYGRLDAVRFLLSRGVNPNIPGGFFGNPLQAAAFQGHQDIVSLLIERQADLFAPGKFSSALDAALAGSSGPVIKFLVEASKITDGSKLEQLLARASYDGHDEVVSYLLGEISQNEENNGNDADLSLHVALQAALLQGHTRVAKRMLDRVVDVNLGTGHFGTALQAAAFGGHLSMVDLALKHGADLNTRGRYGTALRAAALRGHSNVVQLLIEKGANVEGKDADAMQAAAFNGHLSTVGILIDSKLYDCDDSSSIRAIESASFRGHLEVTRLLLQAFGKKAAYYAFSAGLDGGRENVMQLALEWKPEIKASDLPDGTEMLCSAGGGLSLLPSADKGYDYHIYAVSDEGEDEQGTEDYDDSENNSTSDHSEKEIVANESATNMSPKPDTSSPWLPIEEEHDPGMKIAKDSDIGYGNGRLLRIAARKGLVHTINVLIDLGFNINTTGNYSGPSSGQSTPIEVAAEAGQFEVVVVLLRMGAEVRQALSFAVRNEDTRMIRLILNEHPETPLDWPPLRNKRGNYVRPVTPIVVAAAWKRTRSLRMLLAHAKQHFQAIIGHGLIMAARKGNLSYMRSILSDFQLKESDDVTSLARQQHDTFVLVSKIAAMRKSTRMMQLLLCHVSSETIPEQLFECFVQVAISNARWYAVLENVQHIFNPSFYDNLARKALVSFASIKVPLLKGNNCKDLAAYEEGFERLFGCSSDFTLALPDVLCEAAKNNDLVLIKRIIDLHRVTCAMSTRNIATLINEADADGKTPLYFACTTGRPDIFFSFLDVGADTFGLYDPFPLRLVDEKEISANKSRKANLLQIALDAYQASDGDTREWYRWGSRLWERPLEVSYGPIVCHLLDVGLEIDLAYPCLIKFFYVACRQGALVYVKKLLEKGISQSARSSRTLRHDTWLESALHVAAIGGQMAVAEYLLSQGADVRAKANLGNDSTTYNQTAIEAALERHCLSGSGTAIHEVCAYLVASGASESDAELLLVKACQADNLASVKRMLRRGTKITDASAIKTEELYRIFVEANFNFHDHPAAIGRLTENSMKVGNSEFFQELVDVYGQLPESHDLVRAIVATSKRRENRALFLRILIEECSLDINQVYQVPWRDLKMTTILNEAACDFKDADGVSFILRIGANPDSPGLPYTPLTTILVRDAISTSGRSPRDTHAIIKILLGHGADSNGLRPIDLLHMGQVKSRTFRTPLLLAIVMKKPETAQIVRTLLNHGADVNMGRISPLRLSQFFGQGDVENLLREHGARDNSDLDCPISVFIRDLRWKDTYLDRPVDTKKGMVARVQCLISQGLMP
ncbi:hypothetical protein N7447_003223 [Penicillium robsamsonii]|uniref:uncharacterized protein n=1 Tax=Penicillium robsamsonii TaxID=1792511 RepID=UPI00254852B0|nr:uncharacterized protein N7447_003223 [Penicillium robsamsonii]KAJ5837197.1 hypothetical protein N7447_003223 [Penicillium robsamsonii]